jgi:hypothetical protein
MISIGVTPEYFKICKWPSILATCLATYACPIGAAEELPSWGLNESAVDDVTTSPVARMWRSLTLSYGTVRENYREPDPLGRVDPLDSETGSIPITQTTVRWHAELSQNLPAYTLHSLLSNGDIP